jgi:diguanylate cyclase (GGDEF)-like protein
MLMQAIDPEVLADVLRHALDGVLVLEGDAEAARVVYANATLAAMMRREEGWPVGRSLQEIEQDMPGDLARPAGSGVRCRLRAADGTVTECDRWEFALQHGRRAVFYRFAHRPAFDGTQPVPVLGIERGTVLATPEHLVEVLRRDWASAQRDSRPITIMRFDVDAYRGYQDVFGRMATENVMRQVGRTISSAMRRLSDVVARFGEDEFVVLGLSMDQEAACHHAEMILGRIRALAIHHPRSQTGRYLTASAGVATGVPPRNSACELLLEKSTQALLEAKGEGGNCVKGRALD